MSSKVLKTRSDVNCPIFGTPIVLCANVLPTVSDVIKFILYVRHDLQEKNKGKQPSVTDVLAYVCREIEKIWSSASIPTVSTKRIKDLLKRYYDEYLKLIRYPKQKRTDSYEEKVQTFRQTAMTILFDIAACKCSSFDSCTCSKDGKVPIIERSFLIDQRTNRKMMIGSLDRHATQKMQRAFERRMKVRKTENKVERSVTRKIHTASREMRDSIGDIEPVLSTSAGQKTTVKYNTVSLPKLASVCDRYGVSNRSAAAIASAVLQDVGLVSADKNRLVIDKSKLRRARNKIRQNLQDDLHQHVLESIYFDGRKDKTLLIEKKNGRSYRRVVVKEHISLIREPKSHYLGHTTPRIGTGKGICDSILAFLNCNNVTLDDLKCVGCDGTNTNTGWKSGAIRHMELRLKRPLQWFICQLHANELPLRHLFSYLDGRTSGPSAFSGPIGKALETCENLSVKSFVPVTGNLIVQDEEATKSLSTDQKYLFEICHAVASGVCSEELANRQPGNMSHSRWLTTANRILRLYIGTSEPTQQLRVLVYYIMKVYAPIWFQIKRHSSCEMGPKHLFNLMQYSRCLSEEIKSVVDPVIQRNAFFAHPENLLLAMITDDREFARELALRRIIKARKESPSKIRIFKIPQLNFSASDYIEMIHWNELSVTSPPMFHRISDSTLLQMLHNKTTISLEFSKFHCHTQAVERCVKLVTEASITVAGEKARDGLIRTKIQSRSLMPSFDCKAEFRC